MRSTGHLRGALAASTVLAALGLACPAAQAATTSACPTTRGGTAAVEWGINGSEQLAAGFRSVHEGQPNQVIGVSDVRSVQAGFKFAVALLGDCTLVSWGTNNKSQLGNANHLQAQNHPAPVVNLNEVRQVSAANAHALALRYDGTVWTWGASEFGERGNGEKGFERVALSGEANVARPRDEPVAVAGLEHVVQLASGGVRDYALLANGEVRAWGENQNGDLGVEQGAAEEELCYGETHAKTPVPCSTTPRTVKLEGHPLTGVERIAAGGEAAYAVRDGGREVLAWGENSKGQLGDGSTEHSATPQHVRFTPPSAVVELSGGAHHVLARLANGQVYAWGADDSGQLGFAAGGEPSEACGQHACATAPRLVEALNHVVQVAAGESNSLALKEEEDGENTIYSFGRNGLEEVLGLGELAPEATSTPTPIRELGSVGGVSASSNIAVAYLQRAAAPPPLIALTAATESLRLTWTARAEAYRLRWRPAGTKPWSKLLEREGTCAPEGPCSYEQMIEGLGPQPYEVDLVDTHLGEGRATHEKSRYITGTPAPASGAPVITTPPAITGTAQQNQSVAVTNGSWTNGPTSYSYQWLRCEGYGEGGAEEQLGAECEPIEGASGSSYTPQASDVDSSLRVSVKASNAAGWSTALTAAEVVLAAGEESLSLAPQSTSPPAITGTAIEGRTLTEHHGGWDVEPASYSYKWLRCKARTSQGTGGSCGAIPGATAQTYTLGREDVGMWIEVQETAVTSGGFNVASSEALEAIPPELPAEQTPPSVAGTIEKGQTLTVREGTWTNAAKAPLWQWLRCNGAGAECAPIAGATKKTYKIEGEDVSRTLAVSESVENAIGRTAPVDSSATVPVPVPPPAPENTAPPTITGTAQQGQVLSEHPGSWANEPKSYAYAWKRCAAAGNECKAISGATKQTYAPAAADVGHTIVVKETAINAGGSTVANSTATAVVAGAVPADVSPPRIQGPAQQEQQLTVAAGTWTNEPTEYSYQWLQCDSTGASCIPIVGATSTSFSPGASTVGATIRVQETAGNATGAGAPATSAPTSTILPGTPSAIEQPAVSGVAQEGQTLIERPGIWSNAPSGHTLQWLRCNGEGAECTMVEGAAGQTYALTAADVGSTIEARETASNAGGWSSATSEPTAIVTPVTLLVTGIEPGDGPTAGGTAVTITGTNLEEAAAVRFGSSNAASFEIVSPTELRAVSPPGSATVDVTVAGAHSTSPTVSQDRFTYVPRPALSGLSPFKAAAGTEATVTISGSNLSGASSVMFGGQPARTFAVTSPTSITALAPAASGRVVDVTVTTAGGTSETVAADRFYYTEAPEFGRCIAMKGAGAFSNSACTLPAAKSTYEWEPRLARSGFSITAKSAATTLESVGRRSVSCAGAAGQGSYRTPKELALQLTFSGCESAGQKCSSVSAAAGEVRGASLVATLVWEARSTGSAALLLSAEKPAEALWKMQCGGASVEVMGSVLVPVKEAAMTSSQVLKFTATRGIQEPAEYETASGQKVRAYLEASFSGAAFERIGLKTAVVQASEEAVEVNPVA